ncbi:phosphoribosyl-AMP cyclohydrolase [Metallosphaera hakonensis JCM 8857 = DSM 7519]|uniref:Phosphoribosyl-AMP cyclohydrolase n=2 Tax=Metallosphaera hakonensis TaxID=79601 RepID=A0A2U9IUV7_9CREN|nr:phosphoribosyl-AMP cyclohydrolase [Metallosphaera hakonensis]AWR99765.1 phosphoribosyl-AMP cyclohydrolase [Metallosphaera hakonensis JCM 8857 = DSM 7519]
MKLSKEEAESILSSLNFRHEMGTIIAVLQDSETKEVLMVGNMNKEAVMNTLTTGLVHFWSLSRKSLWLKGETSGNLQLLQDFKIDCDGDAILVLVKSQGPVCHTGNRTCFYRDSSSLNLTSSLS